MGCLRKQREKDSALPSEIDDAPKPKMRKVFCNRKTPAEASKSTGRDPGTGENPTLRRKKKKTRTEETQLGTSPET